MQVPRSGLGTTGPGLQRQGRSSPGQVRCDFERSWRWRRDWGFPHGDPLQENWQPRDRLQRWSQTLLNKVLYIVSGKRDYDSLAKFIETGEFEEYLEEEADFDDDEINLSDLENVEMDEEGTVENEEKTKDAVEENEETEKEIHDEL